MHPRSIANSLKSLVHFLRYVVTTSTQVVGPAAAAVAFGVLNRVLYKMALVPLKNYPFFLAQLTTIG